MEENKVFAQKSRSQSMSSMLHGEIGMYFPTPIDGFTDETDQEGAGGGCEGGRRGFRFAGGCVARGGHHGH